MSRPCGLRSIALHLCSPVRDAILPYLGSAGLHMDAGCACRVHFSRHPSLCRSWLITYAGTMGFALRRGLVLPAWQYHYRPGTITGWIADLLERHAIRRRSARPGSHTGLLGWCGYAVRVEATQRPSECMQTFIDKLVELHWASVWRT